MTRKKCKSCKKEITGSRHGEKKWFGWVYWHSKCYKEKFIKEVESNPVLLAKYYSIHNTSPSEKLNQHP